MDRNFEVTKYIRKEQLGIEIGPWHTPLAPKAKGYNCLVLDFYDENYLRQTARKIPSIPEEHVARIESVDFLGTAVDIDRLVAEKGGSGLFDYIISSHNFEHIPNPVKFLQGCSRVLKSGGIISLAIPDKRVCFDFYRPHSTTGDFLDAYFENRSMPTDKQVFDQNSLRSVYRRDGEDHLGFSLRDDISGVVAERQIDRAYREWIKRRELCDLSYIDTHCWVFTPSSFELIINDLYFLGLSDFSVEEVSEANNNEFYAHLRRSVEPWASEVEFYDRRQLLLRKISDELSENVSKNVVSGVDRGAVDDFLCKLSEFRSEVSVLQDSTALLHDLLNNHRSVAQIQQLEATIHALMRSRSWRITAPLRALGSGVRRLVGR